MSEKENRNFRDILITVEAHVEYISKEIKEIKEDKLRQWEKINNLNAGQNHLKGWIAAAGAILISVLVKLVVF